MGIDFFHTKASDYLLIVDYFSRYIEVAGMNKGKRAPNVINILKDVFARHGIPEEIRSDNGPLFDSSEFTNFALEWDILLSLSSPYYPQSNGEAERSVKEHLEEEKGQVSGIASLQINSTSEWFLACRIVDGKEAQNNSSCFPCTASAKVARFRQV